ncbi:MAG: 4'-phosphopantetheinyl transferase family protein [Dysgonomonas sp.]
MLYSREYITETTLLGIWKIEESREELLSMLDYHEWVQNIYSIKSESRVLEILAARVLFKELLGEEKEIYYNSSGKPFFTDESYHISVSHTRGYVGVALNKNKFLGLDLEQISEKIFRVRSRLISPHEYIDENNELIHLLLHWSAKEAMIKFLDVEGIDIRKHLFIDKFIPRERGCFPASESRTETHYQFDVYYRVEKDFVVVCLEANDF